MKKIKAVRGYAVLAENATQERPFDEIFPQGVAGDIVAIQRTMNKRKIIPVIISPAKPKKK